MMGTLLKAPALDVYGQMALDETVLDDAEGDPLVLRFYEWPGGPREPERPHGATFGFMQRYDEAVAGLEARGLPVTFPVVRRPTAGGLVVHDRDVTFSLVFPWSRLASPSLVYKDLHRGVHLGLKGVGLESRLWSPGGAGARDSSCAVPRASSELARGAGAGDSSRAVPRASSELARGAGPARPADCFAEASPMDLVHADGRKLLGGALRRKRGSGLYQGSLRPEGFFVPVERLRKAILDGLSLEWKAAFMPEDAGDAMLAAASQLRAERYRTDDWNRRL